MAEPTAISTQTPSGHTAVSIKVLPDKRSAEVRKRIEEQIKKRIANYQKNGTIDIDGTVKYKRTPEEQLKHQEDEAKQEEEADG